MGFSKSVISDDKNPPGAISSLLDFFLVAFFLFLVVVVVLLLLVFLVYVEGEDALGCGGGGGDGCTLPPFFLGTDFLMANVEADLAMVVESTAAAAAGATVGDGVGDLAEGAEVHIAADGGGGGGCDVCCADE